MERTCYLFVFVLVPLLTLTDAGRKRDNFWTEDFESMVPGHTWKGSLDHVYLTKIVDTVAKDGTPTKALQIKYLKDKFGKDSKVRYKAFVDEAESYVAEFDMKFVKGFDFKLGGKIAGICGGKCTTGCKQSAIDGWSSRFVWKDGNKLKVYVYDQDRPVPPKNSKKRPCGKVYDVGYSAEEGEWIKLKMEVRLNTPNKYDGVIKVWVNGILMFSKNKFRFRGDTNGGLINLFYFGTFFGGSEQKWAPRRDSYALFDNFNVRRPES